MGLPFIVIDLVELFPNLPEGGSIDDAPDIREAMQVIADALPSQLPAQVDYDDEPEPIIPGDPEESPAQCELPKASLPLRTTPLVIHLHLKQTDACNGGMGPR